jgi:hypothetical protein
MSADEEYGRLASGFEGRHCQSISCHAALTEETGAYLHTDRDSGKLVMFCEGCSAYVGLHNSLRFPLAML